MSEHQISSHDQLRDAYRHPNPKGLAMQCILPRIDKHHRAFIAYSPFIVVASANAAGDCDVSPRGDLPGFVTVTNEQTLLIPDRPGNYKILTLGNILENPSIAIIFFIPGRDDSLRVTGKAHIATEPDVLDSMAVKGHPPKSALQVNVEKAWFHCGKAIIRPKLWSAEAQENASKLPTLGQMLSDQIADVRAQDAEESLNKGYETMLWSDPRS
jgi:PPOX class probable FMN-dependent enzyme